MSWRRVPGDEEVYALGVGSYRIEYASDEMDQCSG